MAESSTPDYTELVNQALPVLTSTLLPKDPLQRAKVLRAKIKNYKEMRDRVNLPITKQFYTNEIRKMEAKLDAAEHEIKIKKEGEEATRNWRLLGQMGIATGIVFGFSLVYLASSAGTRIKSQQYKQNPKRRKSPKSRRM